MNEEAIESSSKKRMITLILCILVGGLGVHRFYAGKTGSAFGMLVTFGGLGIWTLVDIIMILMGKFTDKDGKPVLDWN